MLELELYKVFVSENKLEGQPEDTLEYGFILDRPISSIKDLLNINKYYQKNKLCFDDLNKTLFSKSELNGLTLKEKVLRQIIHYLGLGNYGTCSLNINDAKITFDIIKVITKEELLQLINKDIYISKPLPSEKIIKIYELIKQYNFNIVFEKINNNELRALFIKDSIEKLNVNGDDIVRLIIQLATNSTLLIKSKQVLEELRLTPQADDILKLLNLYKIELSEVFNRHKSIFMKLKNHKRLRTSINRISKLSKKNHKPIKLAINKIFINKYLKMNHLIFQDNISNDLLKLTIIDKMKILNTLTMYEAKIEKSYLIRNGKVFIKEERTTYSNVHAKIKDNVYKSLLSDLLHLNGKCIKYPENIDYGLPISEKQSLGELPFGTRIYGNKDSLMVAGIYWENSWGAEDLDLSSLSVSGDRIGWGNIESYSSDVLFSGDITNAPNGAMEYIANTNKSDATVLINNVYNGEDDTKFKIVIGNTNKVSKKYIDNILLEIDCKFAKSKCMSIGALYKDCFILYPIALGDKTISNKKNKAIIPKITIKYYTLKDILVDAGANIISDTNGIKNYIDLSVKGITFQKLIDVLDNKNN